MEKDIKAFVIWQGGWELDETVKAAASREALEEAGVQGKIEVTSQNILVYYTVHSIKNI